MVASISGQPGNSTQVYHYPPIFQDNPNGNCLTGPIKANQPYEIVGNTNADSAFLKDYAYPHLLWAKAREGVLVKNADGDLIYVPPRPHFPGDHLPDNPPNNIDSVSRVDDLDLPAIAAIPTSMINPCPGGLPNNPYSHGSTDDHALQNVVNEWLKGLFHKPSLSDYQKQFREDWVPFFKSMGPTPQEIVAAKSTIANIGKIDEIREILRGTSLDPAKLSREQILKLAGMRKAANKLFDIVDKYELWDEYPKISEISSVCDQEVVKDPDFMKELMKEFASFTSNFPDYEGKVHLKRFEEELVGGWDCLSDRDEHLQALADVLFDTNLKIKELSDWELRFNKVKSSLAKHTLEVANHTPKSTGDLKDCLENSFIGFLNGVVDYSNDPLLQPVFSPIKKYITGELYPVQLTQEQASSWSYHHIKLATQLVADGAMFGAAGKVLNTLKPAIQYAWHNCLALKTALTSDILAKNFLTKAGLISPATGELKWSTKEFEKVLKPSGFCFHDAMAALQKKGKHGYKDCIKEYDRRRGVRQYCIDYNLGTAKTKEIMAIETLQIQKHHILTPKNFRNGFTKRFNFYAKKYGLDLEGTWNKIKIPHMGPHKKIYHEKMLDEIIEIDRIAKGDQKKFLELFNQKIKSEIQKNPLMIRGLGI